MPAFTAWTWAWAGARCRWPRRPPPVARSAERAVHETCDALPAMQFIKSGRLRAICVTGVERSASVGDYPTCAESGMPGLVAVNWWGVLLPLNTPRAVAQKFHADLVAVMKDADLKRRFAELGVDAISSTPEEFAAFMRTERLKYQKLIKDANIQVDN